MMLTLASVLALGLSASPAAARPTVSRLPPPPPPQGTYSTAPVSSSSSSTSQSTATCNATVSSKTEAEAKSAFADIGVALTKTFCSSDRDGWDPVQLAYKPNVTDIKIKAMAKLVIESKIKCDTYGKYAYACGSTWADAKSFAGAAYQAFASAWADIQGAGGNSHCDCGIDVYAQADVVTSQFADVWVEIYNALDDTACATSYGGDTYPSQVDQTKLLECTGEVVLQAWVKAFASLYVKGQCRAKQPVECKACCVDPYGSYYPGCTQEKCAPDCEKAVNQYAQANAKVIIESAVTKNTSNCKLYANGVWDKTMAPYKNFTYTPTINQAANTTVECTASAYADVLLGAWSDQAKLVEKLAISTCNAIDGREIYNQAKGLVETFVDLLQDAYVKCTGLNSGDPNYDGGCALAKSYASGYAEGCGEAIVSIMSDIDFGKYNCDCDVSASAHAEAIAHEVKTVFAFMEQEIEARTCNPDNYGGAGEAYIMRNCVAKSTADLLVKYIAKVTAEGGCETGYKTQYCTEDKCRVYYGTGNWMYCLEECEKESHIKANAYVHALANITVNDQAYCNGESWTDDQAGKVYVTIFNNATTTTGTPGTQTRTTTSTAPTYRR